MTRTAYRSSLVIPALLAGLLGCSHKVKSPDVSVESVEPDLICRSQRSQADFVVTVNGSGFTPQPVNVLEGDQRLVLPSILLDRTLQLDGSAAPGDSGDHLYPGDPEEDLAANLVWETDELMQFRVTTEDAFANALLVDLLPGIYDLEVTNPDDEHKDRLEDALAVIDPPSIEAIAPVPPSLCIEQEERTIEIRGQNFATVESAVPTVTLTSQNGGSTTIRGDAVVAEECVDPPADYQGTRFSLCSKLTVTLPQGGALPAGPYGVVVTSPPPADCSSSETFDVLVVDPPSIASLVPTATCVADGARQIDVTGASFARVAGNSPTVTLSDPGGATTTVAASVGDCTAQQAPSTDFMTELCTQLSFDAEPGLAAGTYGVTAENPDPVGCESVESVELLVVDPPTITAIEPTAVCLEMDDVVVTVTGTSFARVGADEPTLTVTDAGGNGTDYAPDSVAGCGDMVGMAGDEPISLCTELSFTLPAATAEGGYTVSVTNPAPIDCEGSASTELFVVATPTVTDAVPDAVCIDDAAEMVTVTGTSFAQIGDALPTVVLTDTGGATVEVPAESVASCDAPIGTLDGDDVRLCTELSVLIPTDTPLDDYTVGVQNPAPLSCASTTTAPLAVTAPPTVTSVAPMQVCSGGSELVVTGTGFRTGATVTVLCDSGGGETHVVDSLASEASSDGTTLSLRFGFGAIPGETCDVIVSNAMDCDSAPPHPQIDAVDGPIVFNSAPPVVYNGINTQIKLFMTEISGTPEVKIVPSGAFSGGIVLTSTIDPGNDRRIQALVPQDTAPGTYDILVSDDTGCAATLVDGLVVTDTLTIELDKMVQPFGLDSEATAVSIFRVEGDAADNVPFSPTPTAFLNPTFGAGTEPAVQLVGVTFVDDVTLTAVVPDGIALGDYDLVVVDADGNVGVLMDAYTAIDVAPPTIDNVFPQSIVNSDQYQAPDGSNVPQELTVFGDDFSSATVSLMCESPDGMSVAPASVGTGSETCDASGCTITVSVDGSGLAPGDICLVRVENDDGSYADYSAVGVTNPSRNLSNPTAGQDLNTARRACASGAVQATSAARFVYAAGGDGGPTVADVPFDGVEFAPVGVFGGMQPFVDNRESLLQARAFAGTATVGRYIYVFGGTDGTNALVSGERALVLSPSEIPVITDIDLCLSGGAMQCFGSVPTTDGLLTGEYAYRISAVIDPNSVRNLGGETLASDPIIIRLPEIVAAGETRRVAVQLFWTAPVDSLGVELEDIVGYRIYRTPADGIAAADEVLIGEVDEVTFDFIDGGIDGGTDQPLPQGSTSAWQALPELNVARNALAGGVAQDPDDPDTYFVYALLGMDSGDTDALDGTALTSYEFLDVSTLPNGRQDVGAWTDSGATALTGRFLHGAWTADEQLLSLLSSGETWIFLGGGRDAPGNSGVLGDLLDLATVNADGTLTPVARVPMDAPGTARTGFATLAAFDRVFVLGGADPMPRNNANSARIISSTENTGFNNEGIQLVEARYVPGFSVQSAFLFVVGGQTTMSTMGGAITDGDVTSSTEYIVW